MRYGLHIEYWPRHPPGRCSVFMRSPTLEAQLRADPRNAKRSSLWHEKKTRAKWTHATPRQLSVINREIAATADHYARHTPNRHTVRVSFGPDWPTRGIE